MGIFSSKTWHNKPNATTPLGQTGLNDLESRIDAAVAKLSVPQAISSVLYADSRFPSQPTTVIEGGITTVYAYNADGTLHTEARLGTTITYTYDGSGNLTGAS